MSSKKDLLQERDTLANEVDRLSSTFHTYKQLLDRLTHLVEEEGKLHQEFELRQREFAFILREINFYSDQFDPSAHMEQLKQAIGEWRESTQNPLRYPAEFRKRESKGNGSS